MEIPRSYIDNYSKSLNKISAEARSALSKALSRLDYDASIEDIRDAVISVMQPMCGASADTSARLASEFYNGLRVMFDVQSEYTADAVSLRNPDATSGAVRAFVEDIVEGKPLGDFLGKCVDRIDYETRRAANECVAYNAKNDPAKPRWARVPTGLETCEWCIMLASRGFVYHSEETASHTHAHCDCRIVPSWDKENAAAQGYDPELYYDMWKHPEKYEKNELSDDARYYQTVADDLNKKALKQEERALRRMENDYNFMVEALGSGRSYSKIEAFYQGADEAYFKAQMIKAKENSIREAIVLNPSGDREFFGKAVINAAKEFAASTVELPKSITGKSTASTPRIADMRGYFNKDGNPVNFNARDGGYDSWRTWGKAFADKEKKRRYGR